MESHVGNRAPRAQGLGYLMLGLAKRQRRRSFLRGSRPQRAMLEGNTPFGGSRPRLSSLDLILCLESLHLD